MPPVNRVTGCVQPVATLAAKADSRSREMTSQIHRSLPIAVGEGRELTQFGLNDL